MDHSSWVIRDPSLHLLFSHQATEIQFFFLPLASMARGNFRACFYYLLIFFFFFFLSCGYYIILDSVSPLQLPIPRWLLQVLDSLIRRTRQSEVATYLPLISATMLSRAFLFHDNNQTTVHSRKEIAGWEEVNHLMQ